MMWTPLEFLAGGWQGTGGGEPGMGDYKRSYEFILNNKFLFVRNMSTYPPQEQNPQGEIHEDWGIFSYDKNREKFVYRQFHKEGFVNQYVLEGHSPDFKEFSFISESIENIPSGWRARESYQVLSPEELIETFELAAPGKDFEQYTQCHLKKINLNTL
ncbi:MAG TPA: hypothetical protein VLD65_06945 [Anaerolineales bacterium]|nr:hypothetical protein [Anaerolineales bacterium]